jgi:GDP-L-fucose synthase
MVGAAILRQLMAQGVPEEDIVTRTHAELDLTNQAAVRAFFAEAEIDEIYLAAAKVGGIHANNTQPAKFIYENLMIEANIIDAAFRSGVKKLLFLGSSCIYPRLAPQPMREDALLTGPLEPTNEPYAIAKIAGIKLCESYNRQYGGSHGIDYRSVMPTNLYGPGDNYDLENSHVIPALIRKFHEAKVNAASEVVVWGTGTPRRELPMLSHINVGFGEDISISDLAQLVAGVVGFDGDIVFDTERPDGTPQWRPQVSLEEGLRLAYAAFNASEDE